MRSFRTSFVVAAAALAVTWSGASRAEDDVNNKTGTTPPANPTTTTDTSSGTSTDSADGTAQGSIYTTQPAQPYQPVQQQPAQQEPVQTQATTTSTTTTTAATYDPQASADLRRNGWYYRPNRPLLATGLGIFVGTYATSAIVGASSDKDVDKRLYIPVVGPWLDLAQRDCGLGDCAQGEDWNQALLIGSGVLQGVGVTLAVASLFAKETDDAPRSAAAVRAKSTAASKPTVRLMPVSVRSGGGFGAVGTF
jgi:hypothetical protein